MQITSKDNPKIKNIKKLSSKKYRDREGKFVVENATIIVDAISKKYIAETVFYTKSFMNKHKTVVQNIMRHCGVENCFMISSLLEKHISSLDAPSGIFAIFTKPEISADFSKPIVYLNGISDPGNVGSIMRSCVASGVYNIVVDENCADIFNLKTIQAAKDAVFSVSVTFDTKRKIIKEISKKSLILSTRMHKAFSIKTYRPKKNFCVVFGNETRGVDTYIQKMSDEHIIIPMHNDMESLNVSCAAAIILYELVN